MNFLAIFLGGGLGSVTRYALGLLIKRLGFMAPFGTLASNVLASALLLGIIATYSNAIEGSLKNQSLAFALDGRILWRLFDLFHFCSGHPVALPLPRDGLVHWQRRCECCILHCHGMVDLVRHAACSVKLPSCLTL